MVGVSSAPVGGLASSAALAVLMCAVCSCLRVGKSEISAHDLAPEASEKDVFHTLSGGDMYPEGTFCLMQAACFIVGYTVWEGRHDTNYLLLSG